MNKCTACNGTRGKRRFLQGRGWTWDGCYLCEGKGYISQETLNKENKRLLLLKQVYNASDIEYGDILYGKGEKWGPI